MSLRTALWRLAPIHGRALTGRRTAFFTASSQWPQSKAELPYSHHFPREHNAKRSSIRPITFLALCIPLGYCLSWAIKLQDSEDGDGFVKYTLVNKKAVSSTCSIFTLRPSHPNALLHNTSERDITSVQFKQPQLQIARFYTLLPPTQEQDPHEIRFLIRKEHNGEVSGYLHRLPLGSELELRGMHVEYTLPEKVDEVLFLAGGTGIAPAMQVAAAVAGRADVHILWASRRREDCVGGVSDSHGAVPSIWTVAGLKRALRLEPRTPRSAIAQEPSSVVLQLDALKAKRNGTDRPASRVDIDYFVDEEGTFIQRDEIARLIAANGRDSDTESRRRIIFVAGPDGFVNHWAASKAWDNGREVQGPLGGVLSEMDLSGWEVVKL